MKINQNIWLCETCDLIVQKKQGNEGCKFYCPRCDSLLHTEKKDILINLLLLSFSSLVLFYPAFFYPLMKISFAGLYSTASVAQSYEGFQEQGKTLLSLIVFATSLLIPFLLPFLIFLVTFFNKLKIYPRTQRFLFKSFLLLKEWGMTEVFMLAIFIAIIKMHSMATITLAEGIFIFVFYSIINIMIISNLNKDILWENIEEQIIKDHSILHHNNQIKLMDTGIESKLMRCKICGKIIYNKYNEDELECPRCLSKVHYRKPDSLNKSFALLIVSIIFLIPANTLPIMEVTFLGNSTFSTIMDGIIYFFKTQEYGIGIVIFVASILVPIYKVFVILIIVSSIKFNKNNEIKIKTNLFKSIEFIGKWSMLDIFVIALMTVFINFGELSTTYAADAAIYFALVVIATMTAGHLLDIRILWDKFEP